MASFPPYCRLEQQECQENHELSTLQQITISKSCRFGYNMICWYIIWYIIHNPFPQFWVIVHHIFQRDCFVLLQPRIVNYYHYCYNKIDISWHYTFLFPCIILFLIIIIILLNEMFLSSPERSEQPITTHLAIGMLYIHLNAIFTWLWHHMIKKKSSLIRTRAI